MGRNHCDIIMMEKCNVFVKQYKKRNDEMKFITYQYEDQESVGFIEQNKVYPIEGYPMISLIKSYKNIDFEKIKRDANYISVEKIKILSPIVTPIHDIICVGKNYENHIMEMGSSVAKDFVATYFGKRATKIMGLNDQIKGRFDLDEGLDYEAELAVIIGKECKGVKKEEALDYVFGYTILNDLTSRNIQKKHHQWFRGKSVDEHSIMGPWIVTKDEVNHGNLVIQSYVNGELRQNSNTSHMIIKVEEIIEELSSAMTLEPGDIISTGTPEGVGAGYNPPKFLKPGDRIKCEIEGLGSLENTIV